MQERMMDENEAKKPTSPEGCNSNVRSHYGYKFIQWVSLFFDKDAKFFHGEAMRRYLPPIDIAVKIYTIYDICLEKRSFESVFNVMLYWEDPSLVLSSAELNLQDHFVPVYRLQNMRPDANHSSDQYSPESSGILRRYSPKSWVLRWTNRLQAVLKVDMDPSLFARDRFLCHDNLANTNIHLLRFIKQAVFQLLSLPKIVSRKI